MEKTPPAPQPVPSNGPKSPTNKLMKLGLILALVGTLSACTQISPMSRKKKKVVPKVGQLIPSAGTTEGGTALTILGSGFVEGSAVLIGTQPCGNTQVLSATEIHCVTPAGMPIGTLEVVITNPSGFSFRMPSGFRAFDTLPPVAGRVIAAQGGILTGTSGSQTLQLHLTLGEPVASDLQTGQVVGQPGTVLQGRLGIQGVLYDH